MLEIGKKYWFKKKFKDGEMSVKGEVLEENAFMVKIKRDNGSEDFVCFSELLGINQVREETNVQKE